MQANKADEQIKVSTENNNLNAVRLPAIVRKLKPKTLLSYVIWLVSLICLTASPYYFYAYISDSKNEKIELKTGFATKFIKDVTIPDGTPIPINTRFTKTWRVQNIGTVPWKEKHLKRITPQDLSLIHI